MNPLVVDENVGYVEVCVLLNFTLPQGSEPGVVRVRAASSTSATGKLVVSQSRCLDLIQGVLI